MNTYQALPVPDDHALAKSNALVRLIQQEITSAQGFLPFNQFMELALYQPQYGYYQNPGLAIGSKTGDFTTASEISPLYAACFARQCQDIFNQTPLNNLLELGAGTGRFALNILNRLEALDALPEAYVIYEVSASLKAQQQALFAKARPDLLSRITWISDLPEQFSGIIIANEVLDAIPCHCFVYHEGEYFERMVGWENNTFVWRHKNPSPELASAINELDLHVGNGYHSEINLASAAYVGKICELLKSGIVLFADYGYGQHEYYHPQRAQGTLSCFYQHHTHQNPFLYPGLQDITAHVDFTRVISSAADHGGKLLGFTTQSAFLLANHLLDETELFAKDLSEAEKFNLHQAIKILTMPMEMGDVIKIMAIGIGCNLTLQGFTGLDRRRDL